MSIKSVKQAIAAFVLALPLVCGQTAKTKHLLYVASPGIRNYTEWGGVGVVVFDIDGSYSLS